MEKKMDITIVYWGVVCADINTPKDKNEGGIDYRRKVWLQFRTEGFE